MSEDNLSSIYNAVNAECAERDTCDQFNPLCSIISPAPQILPRTIMYMRMGNPLRLSCLVVVQYLQIVKGTFCP
jgi:hypothetical protein